MDFTLNFCSLRKHREELAKTHSICNGPVFGIQSPVTIFMGFFFLTNSIDIYTNITVKSDKNKIIFGNN